MFDTPLRVAQQRGRGLVVLMSLALSLLLTASWAAASSQSLDKVVRFDVPAGEAADTLKEAARQADVAFIYTARVARCVKTKAVRGRYTPEQAFARMLEGSPLRAYWHEPAQAFAIRKAKEATKLKANQGTPESMNSKQVANQLKALLKRLAAAAAIAVPATSVAQQADEEDDDIFELSPFQVDASDDQGYRATSTLAGTRLNSRIADIGAAVSVVTSQFLEDTNSKDLEDLLVFTTNTEVGGLGGNFSASTQGGGRRNFEGARTNPQRATRVRGLAELDLTRNFFLTSIPVDSYNVEKITINRGPNSILFGLGSPGGVLDSTLKKANVHNDRFEFTSEVGRFGTFRQTADVNKVLVEDKLAVRMASLYEEEEFDQDEAFEDDFRFYGDLIYRPFKNTAIRISGEKGDIDANRPRVGTPIDRVSFWWEDGKPEWNPPIDDFGERDAGVIFGAGNAFRELTLMFDDPRNSNPGSGLTTNVDAMQHRIFRNDDNIGEPFLQDMSVVALVAPPALNHRVSLVANRPSAFPSSERILNSAGLDENDPFLAEKSSFFQASTITDRSIFDFREELVDGPNKFENQDFYELSLNLEQTFFDNRLGIDLVYDKQVWENFHTNPMLGAGPAIAIDINRTLINGNPNPNFGRPFNLSNVNFLTTQTEEERKSTRITGFWEIRSEDFFKNETILNWLGKTRVTGLYNPQQIENISKDFAQGAPTPEFTETYLPAFAQSANDINAGGRVRGLAAWRFLGPSLADRSGPEGANIQGLKAKQIIPSQVNNFLGMDPAANEIVSGRSVDIVSLDKNPAANLRSSSHLDQDIETWGVTLQSFFANDNIVFTWGWRSDDVEQFNLQADEDPFTGVALPGQFDFSDGPDIVASETTTSWGLVGHSPNFINEALPFDTHLSIHYNESENLQAAAGGFNISGEPLEFPQGKTEEYGFTLNTHNEKLNLRVNWFETDSTNSRISNPGGSFVLGIAERVYLFNTLEDITNSDWQDPPEEIKEIFNWRQTGTRIDENGDTVPIFGFDGPGEVSVASTQEFTSKGVELELTYNPTQNWRIFLTAARQETEQANTAPAVAEWIEERRSVWFEGSSANLSTFTGGSDTVQITAFNDVIVPFRRATAQDGGPVQELREWRWTLVTNYQFSSDNDFTPDWLDGLDIGSSIRWQDEAAIGFPLAVVDADGNLVSDPLNAPMGSTVVPDVENPFFDDSITKVDFWINYDLPLFEDYVNWSLRFHVRNAINAGIDGGLIPLVTNPNGERVQFRQSEPTLWTLSSTIEF